MALRTVGASVKSLASLGDGCPDLLVGFRRQTHLIEIKAKGGRLTDAQKDWIASWHGEDVHVVNSIEDALWVIGAIQRRTR